MICGNGIVCVPVQNYKATLIDSTSVVRSVPVEKMVKSGVNVSKGLKVKHNWPSG